MKNLKTIILIALFASLVLNVSLYMGWLPVANIPMSTDAEEVKMSTHTMLMVGHEENCTGTVDMSVAESWIAKVNAEGIKFNNKSIFICPDAIRAMLDLPDFDGIWVRRGMDDDKVIHDLAWASVSGGASPSNAYLLAWKSCVCQPCCGSDTSDFADY